MRVKNVDAQFLPFGEILVGYEYEDGDGNPSDVSITNVELVVKGKGVQILPLLTPKQIDKIEENLSFNVYNS